MTMFVFYKTLAVLELILVQYLHTGGFNFYWAWVSGRLAGLGAGKQQGEGGGGQTQRKKRPGRLINTV
jgi:hypothetical protein